MDLNDLISKDFFAKTNNNNDILGVDKNSDEDYEVITPEKQKEEINIKK